ncbi:hypothetical protein [Nocardioides mesophilus]|uniref:VCBS repeat-containing protein n=1 Tax=Nocardioides mesophilus TaxID=433659 RepID=A0A7G9RE36_9ACTN|nr:hypothetical protein [Nocardioides mesophilus]QNN53861.1 hypothetical protein H9L09_05560 [Nocardioides mesophilus]
MRRLTPLLAVSAAPLALLAVAPSAPAAPAGVCAGVRHCTVVARVDVDGDGRRDAVGLVRRGGEGAPVGAVVVRVSTAAGTTATAHRRTENWSGSLWQGAADVDGRPGRELFVGYTQGAHAELFHALTWKQGDLRTRQAPGRGIQWLVDGAAQYVAGWQQRATDPPGTIRQRRASLDASLDSWTGTVKTYRWSADGWQRIHAVTRTLTNEQAARWAGFRIPGLETF